MNIGIDIRTLMDSQYSGVSEYTYNLVKEILRLDKVNQYKLFYNSGRDVSGRIPKFISENVEVVSTHYPNKLYNYIMQKTFRYPKIDQLLGVDLFFMPHIGFASLSNKCKSILTIHDLSFIRYQKFYSLRKNLWHKLVNTKKLLNQFDTIIAVSENTKSDIIELGGVDNSKVKVIYSAVEGQFRKISKEEPDFNNLDVIRAKYDLPWDFILFLGTIEPRKNIIGLIKAFSILKVNNSNLKSLKLVIAGGQGWKSKSIFKEWEKSKYKADIKFLGYVDREDKVYLYNLAKIFIYPSFYEGFGFPPLEAMSSGTPVVSSNISSLPEIMGGAALLVDPYNVNRLAKSIEKVLLDDGIRKKLIAKGFDWARQFSWQQTAQNYLALWHK
ncbi:MAG: glycosyltransferase family 1 protein [Patescibacteria group bacterium]